MNSIIELKNPDIVQLGVEAIVDFYRTMAIDQLPFSGMSAFATGVDSSSLNVLLDYKDQDEFKNEDIAAIQNFFKTYQVPWGWFKTAVSKTTHIESHGFHLSYEMPGMYFDLSKKLPDFAIDVQISEMHGDLKKWIEPLQEGFPSSDNCEGYRKLNAKLLLEGEKKLRHFTAFRENEAASSGTLFISDRSVMLHNLATKNKFRQCGMGSALTLYMMNEAKKAGYTHCYLDSSDEGFNLYKRLGWQVYCSTSVYELSAT